MATSINDKQGVTNNDFETSDSDKDEIKLIAVVSEERKVNSCSKKSSSPLPSKENCINTESDDSDGIDLIIEDVCEGGDAINSALKKLSSETNNKMKRTTKDDDSKNETADSDCIESVIDTICEEEEFPEVLQKINSDQNETTAEKENINSAVSEPDDLDSVIEAICEDESDFELNVSSDSCKEKEMSDKNDSKTDLTDQDDCIDSAIEAICEEEEIGTDPKLNSTSKNTKTVENDFVAKVDEPDDIDSVIEAICEEEEEIADVKNSISKSDKNAKEKIKQQDVVKDLSELDDSLIDAICEEDEEQEPDLGKHSSSNSKNERSETCAEVDLQELDEDIDEVIEAVCEDEQKPNAESKDTSLSNATLDESIIEHDDSEIRIIELDNVDETDKTECIKKFKQNCQLKSDIAENCKTPNHINENKLECSVIKSGDFEAVIKSTSDEADLSENCKQGHSSLTAENANEKEKNDTVSTKTSDITQNRETILATDTNDNQEVIDIKPDESTDDNTIVKNREHIEINALLNTVCTEVHKKLTHQTAEDKNDFNLTSCSSPTLHAVLSTTAEDKNDFNLTSCSSPKLHAALSTLQQRNDYNSRKLNEGIECLVSYLVKTVSFNTFSQSSSTKRKLSDNSEPNNKKKDICVNSITSERNIPTECSNQLKRRASQCDESTVHHSEQKRLKDDCLNVKLCANIDICTDESSSLDSNVSSKKRLMSDSEDSGTECNAIKKIAKESLSGLIDSVVYESLSHSSCSSLLKESNSSKLEFSEIKNTPKKLPSLEGENLDNKKDEESFLSKTISSIGSLNSVSNVQKNLTLPPHLLQTMCEDSSDSEKSSHASSLKIDESVQNIIQRLSSPKGDSSSVSDIEIDSSNSVTENSESLKFTTTKFDITSASLENGDIEKSDSVSSDAKQNSDGLDLDSENNDETQNSELKVTISTEQKTNDEPSEDLNENETVNESKSPTSCFEKVKESSETFSELKTENLSVSDSTTVDGEENGISLSAKSPNGDCVEENKTEENGMCVNDDAALTLSDAKLRSMITKNFETVLGSGIMMEWAESEKKEMPDRPILEEERKRIDQLRSTLRAMIMQQRTFYRNCAYTPKVDTRTVGVNVQILKDGVSDSKCLNSCPIHCRCNVKSEPELSSSAIRTTIPITSSNNTQIESRVASTCASTLMKLPSTSISLVKEESTTEPSPPVGKTSDRNLIGFPPVAMPTDVTVRSLDPQQETSVSQKKAGESNVPQIVDLTDDDDPPKQSETKVMPPKTITITKVNQPSNKVTSPSTNAPMSVLPPLGSMVQVLPPNSNTGSPRPDGNIRMVRSGAFMPGSQRLAYFLPPGASPVFSQVQGSTSRPVAYRPAQTPNGLSNMVILAPLLPPNQSGTPRVAVRSNIRQTVPPSHVGNFVSSSQLTLTPRFSKHPAPLPQPPAYPANSNLKALPPKPTLKMNRTVNGIVLSWNMNLHNGYADVTAYQLYAYQENNGRVDSSLWKKVSDIKAMPLPMACTLTQFVEDHKYHFAVRAVDAHRRVGPFSDPVTVQLLSKGGSSKACANNARS